MKNKTKTNLLWSASVFVLIVAVILGFAVAMDKLADNQNEEHRLQLEESIRLASVSCYANEGKYPSDLEYLAEHYGVQIDSDRYAVYYEVFAENLMPEITVVERK